MTIGANEIGSEAWCAEMSEVLANVELPEVQATVEQRIGDGDGGPVVSYRLVIDSGRAHLAPSGAEAADEGSSELGDGDGRDGDDEGVGIGFAGGDGVVVMSQSRATAEAVRRGELGALAALQAGLITVSGDVRVLIVAAEALALVNTALGHALAGEGAGTSGPGADATERTGDESGGTSGGSAHGSTDGASGTGG